MTTGFTIRSNNVKDYKPGRINDVLTQLNLPATLMDRIHVSCDNNILEHEKDRSNQSYVLYLPTTVLRYKHNCALAVACHLANYYKVPLVILCTVLDDAHYELHPQQEGQPKVVSTARRLAFTLQALQTAAADWERHTGAAVYIRVHHGAETRRPHYLTLARQALVTVVDEPFVQPFSTYVCQVERAVKTACLRVDGSTTVPPRMKLRKVSGSERLEGVPTKSFYWKEMTDPHRKSQVYGAVHDKDFDAPVLENKCTSETVIQDLDHPLRAYLPKEWFDISQPAPSVRAWTVHDVCNPSFDPVTWVKSIKDGSVDQSVPVCTQTHGAHGWQRWRHFKEAGALAKYAKSWSNLTTPHAVSRLSCYLNLGTISIFQIVYELWQTPFSTEKFQDEIIKWREMSYVHTIAHPGSSYFEPNVLPSWSRTWLEHQYMQSNSASTSGYTLDQLASSQTGDLIWDAMQTYLRETGELHNNARMSWAKTVIHWQAPAVDTRTLFQQLSFLNDRYALDGLSPPSYGGLCWCMGWCDKPDEKTGGISNKPAYQYRVGPEGFVAAQRLLLAKTSQSTITSFLSGNVVTPNRTGARKEQRSRQSLLITSNTESNTTTIDENKEEKNTGSKRKKDILSYFSPVLKDKKLKN